MKKQLPAELPRYLRRPSTVVRGIVKVAKSANPASTLVGRTLVPKCLSGVVGRRSLLQPAPAALLLRFIEIHDGV